MTRLYNQSVRWQARQEFIVNLKAIIFIEKLSHWTHKVDHMAHKGIAQRALPASGVRVKIKV